MHLVIIAGLVAVVAVGVLLLAVNQRHDAMKTLGAERKKGEEIAEMVATYSELKTAEQNATVRFGQAEDLKASKIKNAATAAGIKNPQEPTRQDPGKDLGGVRRIKVSYEIRDESMPNLMKWIQIAVHDIPGLEVYSVTLKPEASQWLMKVTFCRWERVESKK